MLWALGDAWGGSAELDAQQNTLVLVRDGAYVSDTWGGTFRRQQPDLKVVGANGPIFGVSEGDAVHDVR